MRVPLRLVALWIAFVASAAPLRLAFLVASMEPTRHLQLNFLLPFGLAGLALSASYFGLAAFPRVFERTGLTFRIVGSGVLLVSALITIFLFHSVSSIIASQSTQVALSLLACTSVAVGSVWLVITNVWRGWLSLLLARYKSAV